MFLAATTSSHGWPVNETLTVSPIPSNSNAPIPKEDLTRPVDKGPAAVTPRCSGYLDFPENILFASIVVKTSDAFSETIIS